jgi:hypothetical protein
MLRSFIVKLFKKFKLLKLLDFEDAPIDYLPQEVGNLFHLKHLSLRRTKVKILPKSMGRLQNLQTLNVLETAVRELPIEIFRLCKLRHLLAHYHDLEIESIWYAMQGVKVRDGFECLSDLLDAITCRGKSSRCWSIHRAGKVESVEDAGHFKYGSRKWEGFVCLPTKYGPT